MTDESVETKGKDWKFKAEKRKLTPQEEQWKKTAFRIMAFFLILFVAQILVYTFAWSFNDWVCVLIIFIVLVMPGYLSNAGMLIVGGGKPMDGGRMAKDGRRLFGPGKTWRGFIGGPLFIGIPIALGIHLIFFLTWPQIEAFTTEMFTAEGVYDLFARDPEAAVNLFKMYLVGARGDETLLIGFFRVLGRVICISYATSLGDLIGSWSKRRIGRKRGEPVWLVDQLDFIFFVLLAALPFVVIDLDFLTIVIFSLIFTPSLTVIANSITYFLGHKSVPY